MWHTRRKSRGHAGDMDERGAEKLPHRRAMQAGRPADVFALGIVLWELLTLKKPYSNLNIHRVGVLTMLQRPGKGSQPGGPCRHANLLAACRLVLAVLHRSSHPISLPASSPQVALHVLEGGRPAVPSVEDLPGGAEAHPGLEAYVGLMQRCWQQDPKARPTIDEVVPQLRALLEAAQRAVRRPGSEPPASSAGTASPPATSSGSGGQPLSLPGGSKDSSGSRACRLCGETLGAAHLRPLVPCGHSPACAACSVQLLDSADAFCPECRAPVTGFVQRKCADSAAEDAA